MVLRLKLKSIYSHSMIVVFINIVLISQIDYSFISYNKFVSFEPKCHRRVIENDQILILYLQRHLLKFGELHS